MVTKWISAGFAFLFLTFLTNCSKKDDIVLKHPSGKPKIIVTSQKWFFSDHWTPIFHKELHFNKNEKFSSPLKQGKFSGTSKSWYQRGHLKSVGDHVQGKRQGKWEFYYEKSEDLSMRGYYNQGRRQGKWEEWWPGYIKKSLGEYTADSQSGVWYHWNEQEVLIKKSTCFSDTKWGSRETYYPKGSIKTKISCYHGKPQGKFSQYHENGQVALKGEYDKHSQKNDLWEGFYPSGKQASRELFNSGKWVDTVFYWDDKGNLKSRGYFEDGTGTLNAYNATGTLIESNEWVKGKRQGKRKIYYASGNVKSITTYQDDKAVAYIHWHEGSDGKLTVIQEGRYKSGKRSGIWKWYSKQGKLKEETNYHEGKKHGESRIYNPATGKLTRTQTYEHGIAKMAKLHK